MINLLNKLLARFGFQLVSIKPDTRLVKETLRFMNENPKYFDGYNIPESTCVGEIKYIQERVKGEFPQVSGKTYYAEQHYGTNKKYFNFDGERYAPEELAEKLKND
jgi:hypothetical protein